jgi:hypothetical protein
MHLTCIGSETTGSSIDGDAAAGAWTRQAELVFVVGAPRSGTTWLQAMLGSHPCVATGPETHYFKMMSPVATVFARKLPRPVGLDQYLSAEEFYAAVADLFHRVASKVPAPRGPRLFFLEKTPEHALCAPFILRCLPRARFIHLVRDGRHVAASLIRAHSNWDKPDEACSASIAIQVWQNSVEAARRIPELLAGRDHYREVRYEDLRRSPQQGLTALLEWLQLPVHDGLIQEMVARNDLEKTRRNRRFDAISLPGKEQPSPGGTEPEVFFGKAAIAPEGFDLTRLQEYQCYRLAGELLAALGYCAPCPRVPWWAALACSWKLRSWLRLPPV